MSASLAPRFVPVAAFAVETGKHPAEIGIKLFMRFNRG
jgi:hypothetical protein